jgi:hypothetical protein
MSYDPVALAATMSAERQPPEMDRQPATHVI